MKILSLINYLESIAPLSYQESYDNAGLITGHPEWDISGVMISLDATEAVIDDAIAHGCNVVVSHHPIVFKGLKKINGHSYVERAIIKAIKNDIALYAIHTNLDNVYESGVSGEICARLDLANTSILAPDLSKNHDGKVGSGMIGDMKNSMSMADFRQYIKDKMQVSTLKHTKMLEKTVSKVAVCGGSGSFLIDQAKKAGADVYISADFKYHEFFDAEDDLMIVDIGHYESERFTIDLLYERIRNNFSNFASHCTKINTNPVNYF